MPGDFGVLVVTRVLFTTTKCTRDRGCIVRPASPTPSLGEGFLQKLGRIAPRDQTRVEIEARTSQPVVPANAGIHNRRMLLLCRGVGVVFQISASLSMGPGVRRDDAECGARIRPYA